MKGAECDFPHDPKHDKVKGKGDGRGKGAKSDKANKTKHVHAAPALADTAGTDVEPACPAEKSDKRQL